ncbi:uncharacterized protein LOC118282154 [Spodoptera frugiperda]|uniref:Uncharacterized protein LOC118282154 n=1 Tax=Spodoptera frugiperda TaxID=7108 RepID=A0A9R0DKV5_SPOFR|nr:uncharacterized protein LOC118282154 [Spodoptera frugiperda]
MSFLYVVIYYGPCETFGTHIHKPQIVNGIKDDLQNKGYRVKLVPVNWVNYCMLEICGHEVFRCNLKNLKFNTSVSRDVTAQRAVEAVLVCSSMFRRARAYLWFWSLLDHQLFRRTIYGPQDYFVSSTDDDPPYVSISPMECAECCGIPIEGDEASMRCGCPVCRCAE